MHRRTIPLLVSAALLTAGITLAAPQAQAATTAVPDPIFAACLNGYLRQAMTAPITTTQLAGLTGTIDPVTYQKTIHCEGTYDPSPFNASMPSKIMSIEGAQYLTGITWLDLGSNLISDISPLASLTNLVGVNLDSNQISDVRPLAGLTNLHHFGLSNNAISDISPLPMLPGTNDCYSMVIAPGPKYLLCFWSLYGQNATLPQATAGTTAPSPVISPASMPVTVTVVSGPAVVNANGTVTYAGPGTVKFSWTDADSLFTGTATQTVVSPKSFTTAPTPAISGCVAVGNTLTAVPGAWSPSGAKLFYQWLRDGVAINGATASTYTLTTADLSRSVSVRVTGTLLGYTTTSRTSTPVTVLSDVVRAAGVDRFDTATLVAQQGWTSSSTVYLAYGQNFPDALAGVSLATVNDAPILLTDTDKAPDSTMAQLKSLGAKNVVLLGGTVAISAKVEKQLTTAGYSVSRIAGIDRYDTAALIGKQVLAKSKATTAVIATGEQFADALSISPVAGMEGWPVLFANGNTLPQATSAFIKANKITTVYIVGGTGAVSAAVESQLKALGVTTVTRLAGVDRYDTSAKIATKFKSSFASDVSVATGRDFPDALAGGVLSAKLKVPMLLLNPKTGAIAAEQAYVKGLTNPKVYVYGGTTALPDLIVKTLLG